MNITTEAIIAYEKLRSMVDMRIAENYNPDNIKFWMDVNHKQGAAIADRYGMTVADLVNAWVAWRDTIDPKRAAVKAGA